MKDICLTHSEAIHAAICGSHRHLASLFQGDQQRFCGRHPWEHNIEGACGEMAAAIALNLHNPMTVNTYHDADLGESIQVRCRSNHSYDLIIREDDNPEEFFVLVTGSCPYYQVHGFMLGEDGMREEFWADPGNGGGAFFVPKDRLRPLEEIPVEARGI